MKPIPGGASIGGVFKMVAEDADGKILWEEEFRNSVTSAGLDHMLNVVFRGTTQVTTWYMGLVDNAGFTQFQAGDTMSSHSGWSESAAYSESTRPAWSPGAPSSNTISNGTEVEFTINADNTAIRGAFITSNSTKSGTTGTLASTGSLSGGPQTLNTGSKLKLTYSLPMTAT